MENGEFSRSLDGTPWLHWSGNAWIPRQVLFTLGAHERIHKQMSILEAAATVLATSKHPLSAREIHAAIVSRGLFSFRAKDPVGIVRNAIRRHLRAASPVHAAIVIREIEPDRFSAI